jgi:hypothetical protein
MSVFGGTFHTYLALVLSVDSLSNFDPHESKKKAVAKPCA